MSGPATVATEIYQRYKRHYDGETQGCCLVIVSDILNKIGGEPVAGHLVFGDTRRSHWWVEFEGITLDPMGDDLMSHESWFDRDEEHRDRNLFERILPDYERWRVL